MASVVTIVLANTKEVHDATSCSDWSADNFINKSDLIFHYAAHVNGISGPLINGDGKCDGVNIKCFGEGPGISVQIPEFQADIYDNTYLMIKYTDGRWLYYKNGSDQLRWQGSPGPVPDGQIVPLPDQVGLYFANPGCMDMDACNFESYYNYPPVCGGINDGDACEYPEENYDCEGNCIAELDCTGECGGSTIFDDCGWCGGDNTSVEECLCYTYHATGEQYYCTSTGSGVGEYEDNVCSEEDNCGVCDGTMVELNGYYCGGDEDLDCESDPYCVCDGHVEDCALECDGLAWIRECADCGGGCGYPPPVCEAAEENYDCDGNCTEEVDDCGVCDGGGYIECSDSSIGGDYDGNYGGSNDIGLYCCTGWCDSTTERICPDDSVNPLGYLTNPDECRINDACGYCTWSTSDSTCTGCMDPNACNYDDSNIIPDLGDCKYASVDFPEYGVWCSDPDGDTQGSGTVYYYCPIGSPGGPVPPEDMTAPDGYPLVNNCNDDCEGDVDLCGGCNGGCNPPELGGEPEGCPDDPQTCEEQGLVDCPDGSCAATSEACPEEECFDCDEFGSFSACSPLWPTHGCNYNAITDACDCRWDLFLEQYGYLPDCCGVPVTCEDAGLVACPDGSCAATSEACPDGSGGFYCDCNQQYYDDCGDCGGDVFVDYVVGNTESFCTNTQNECDTHTDDCIEPNSYNCSDLLNGSSCGGQYPAVEGTQENKPDCVNGTCGCTAQEWDCTGECGGETINYTDNCGDGGAVPAANCVNGSCGVDCTSPQDCSNYSGATGAYDCGTATDCDGTGCDYLDCGNVCDGDGEPNECGVCIGTSSGGNYANYEDSNYLPSPFDGPYGQDCDGACFSGAVFDGYSNIDECPENHCTGGGSDNQPCVQDCAEIYYVEGSTPPNSIDCSTGCSSTETPDYSTANDICCDSATIFIYYEDTDCDYLGDTGDGIPYCAGYEPSDNCFIGGTRWVSNNADFCIDYNIDICGVCGGDGSSCCIDRNACNYQGTTPCEDYQTEIGNHCCYVEENYDCDGHCIVGVDCNGDCGGRAILDSCKICGYWGEDTSTSAVVTSEQLGCDGVCFSCTVIDECGVCGGDNSTCTDCDKIPHQDCSPGQIWGWHQSICQCYSPFQSPSSRLDDLGVYNIK